MVETLIGKKRPRDHADDLILVLALTAFAWSSLLVCHSKHTANHVKLNMGTSRKLFNGLTIKNSGRIFNYQLTDWFVKKVIHSFAIFWFLLFPFKFTFFIILQTSVLKKIFLFCWCPSCLNVYFFIILLSVKRVIY